MNKYLNIGFTGTQVGMTEKQKEAFEALLKKIREDVEDDLFIGLKETPRQFFHHGDCIGADAEAHLMAESVGFRVVIHPPLIETKRAFSTNLNQLILPAKDYLARNRDIVLASDILIATPKTNFEELRSGTWSTVRFARKKLKPIYIIYPDGSHEKNLQ